MKKLLSFLLVFISAFTCSATDITFVGGTDMGSTTSTGADEMTKDGITISSTNAALAYNEYRFYNGTITISSTVGTITAVTVNCTNDSYASVLAGSTSNPGSLSQDGTSITWTGNTTELTIRNTSQIRASKIVVTINGNVTPPDPPTPDIVTVNSIAEINALADNTSFKYEGFAICLAHVGQRLYIQDEDNGTLVYGTINDGITYTITEIIPSGWKGVKTTHAGSPEVKTPSNFTAATNWQKMPATEIHLNAVDAVNDFARYAVIKNATISIEEQHAATEVMFDFLNDYQTLFGIESSDDLPYDITEDITISKDNVTMTITPNGGGTPNRIWNNPVGQLRMYGGTLTIKAPTGYNVTNLSITQKKWNSGNSANTGTLTSTAWTGSTNELVITIASNTQFNSISVTLAATRNRVQSTTENLTIATDEGSIQGYTKSLYSNENPCQLPDDLTKQYHVYGILDNYNGTAQVLPLGFEDPDTGVITEIKDINMNNIVVKKYCDIMGHISDEPFDGINIIIMKDNTGNIITTKEIH